MKNVYYPYISDGDNLFAISPYANCNNIAGFKNNGDDVSLENFKMLLKQILI